MKKYHMGLWILAAVCLFAQGVSATSVPVLLEQGIYTEETVGDLGRAIEIYAQIIEDEQANRKYVAEAMFRSGRCNAEKGNEEEALNHLQYLIQKYPDQKQLIGKAELLINELTPKPLFPELDGCRLKYTLHMALDGTSSKSKAFPVVYYPGDFSQVAWTVAPELEDRINRFGLFLVPADEKQMVIPYNAAIPRNARSIPPQLADAMHIGQHTVRLIAYDADGNELARSEQAITVKPAMYAQIGVNDLEPNGDIRFVSVTQTPNIWDETQTQSFINSDFVHIESMFDENGDEVEFTETHENNIYRYHVTLNKPVYKGQTLYGGSKGWSEGLVKKVENQANTYRYRMTHSPGTMTPTRRVTIFRLPSGAQLLSTLPSDLPHRVLEDGRVELLVDTVIPAGGSLLTQFQYRLTNESDKYVTQIVALKNQADSKEKQEALEQIEAITANATFHQGALVELAKLVPSAEFNHQRIVKAAELTSTFGYHTGALVEVAKIAANADRECEELDAVLELVVLKLGGTPSVVQLARDAVKADSNEEKDSIRSRITDLQESADYRTLAEGLEGQKSLLESASKYKPLSLQPAPWEDGDTLRFRLLTKTGMEMGHLIWAVNDVEHEGKACWKVEQRLVIPSAGSVMASYVIAEKGSFMPISGRTTHQLGTVEATYFPGKVLLQHKSAGAPREVEVPEPIYDNEQVIFLMRRLPLAEKYSVSFPIMSVLSGASGLECRIRVMKRESVEVSSESRDCWKIRIQVYMGAMKAVEQTAWFTVEGHVPVKFVTDHMDMELAEHTDSSLDVMELKDHGATVHVPNGWFAYELPSAGKDLEIVRLLPPEMKLTGILCKTVRQPVSMSVSEIVKKDWEVLKGYFKNYTVREDTVVEKDVNGMSAKIYSADYEDQGKAMVEYRAYYVVDSRVFWFVFRMDADQFDTVKAELDELIEGLEVG